MYILTDILNETHKRITIKALYSTVIEIHVSVTFFTENPL